MEPREGGASGRAAPGDSRAGLIYGIAAYGLWGAMPVYFRALINVPAIEVLAHRVVWSAVLLLAIVTILGHWKHVAACLRDRRTRWLLLAGTVLIGINWYVFVYGVSIGQVVQNSLGYFINPLLNILIGVTLFGERLRPAQWVALALAGAGLVYLVVAQGQWPWIALWLACSFATYGLIRKVAPVDTLLALTVETLLLTPAAAAALAVWYSRGELALGAMSWPIDALLLLSGAATTLPLFCFGQAARMVRMTTLGFLQYIAPTLQFLTAVLVFGEPFGPDRQVSFTLIWSALALVTLDALRAAASAEVSTAGPP